MANVLETFYILFDSDASKAAKEGDKLNDSLDDTSKAADKAVNSSDDAGASFLKMGKSALGAVAGVFALTSIVAGFNSKIAQQDELGKFSKLIGENVGDVDAWGQAVSKAGGDAASFRQSVQSLNEQVVDASVKGMNEIVPFFNQLGISIVDTNGKARSTLDLLPELADSFQSLSKNESSGLGKKLGLDDGTILLLQKGRKAVEEMVDKQKEYGVASAESTEISRKFKAQMADLTQVMGFSSQRMLTGVLPAITAILGVFTELGDWMNDNEALVQGFFIGVGAAVLKFAIPSMILLAKATWAAALPFLAIAIPIAAVGAAVALLFEDIKAFVSGQDSLLGKMVEKWPIFGAIVKHVFGQIGDAFNILKGIASFLFDVFTNPIAALEKLIGLAKGIGGKAKGAIKFLFGFGGDDGEDKKAGDDIANAKKTLELASASNIGAQTSNSIQNSSTTRSKNTSVQTGDIVIQTQATNPDGIASEVAGSLSKQLRTAVDNFDDGVVI